MSSLVGGPSMVGAWGPLGPLNPALIFCHIVNSEPERRRSF